MQGTGVRFQITVNWFVSIVMFNKMLMHFWSNNLVTSLACILGLCSQLAKIVTILVATWLSLLLWVPTSLHKNIGIILNF